MINKIDEIINSLNRVLKIGRKTSQKIVINFLDPGNIKEIKDSLNDLSKFTICDKCNLLEYDNKCINNIISSKLVLVSNLNSFLEYRKKINENYLFFSLEVNNLNDLEKDVKIEKLSTFINVNKIDELIFLLNGSPQLNNMIDYIKMQIKDKAKNIIFSKLPVGIPYNSNAIYFDEETINIALNKREKYAK